MRTKEAVQSITAATPATAQTAIHATLFKGSVLTRADKLVIDASLTAGAGGTLDVYLQRRLGTNLWADWIHFAQVTAAATARATVTVNGDGSAVTVVGQGTDASPGVALAAATSTNCIPGDDVRIVFVTGVGTAGAGSVTISIQPYSQFA